MSQARLKPATSAEGRRTEILDATLRVIADGGTDMVTHRRVAAEADVPLGSLTYYFESREDLIREAFRRYIAEGNEFLSQIEQEIPPDSPEGLVELIVEVTRREFARPQMVLAEYALILHAARDPQIAREFAAWERNLEARLAASLEAMGADRPLNAARTVLHLVRGFELQHLAHRVEHHSDLADRLTSVVEALVAAPRPGPTTRTAKTAKTAKRSKKP